MSDSDENRIPDINQTNAGGVIHVSEDVIVELAKKTIEGIANIKTAAKFSSKFALKGAAAFGLTLTTRRELFHSMFIFSSNTDRESRI